jgi:hypothetical protein
MGFFIVIRRRPSAGLVDTVEYGGVPYRIVDTGGPVSRTMLIRAYMIRDLHQKATKMTEKKSIYLENSKLHLSKSLRSTNNSSKPPYAPSAISSLLSWDSDPSTGTSEPSTGSHSNASAS